MATVENGHIVITRGELLILLDGDRESFLLWLNSADEIAVKTKMLLDFQGPGGIDLESDILRDEATGLIPYLVAGAIVRPEIVAAIDAFVASERDRLITSDSDATQTSTHLHRWRLPNGIAAGSPTQWFTNASIEAEYDGADFVIHTDADVCTFSGAIQEK